MSKKSIISAAALAVSVGLFAAELAHAQSANDTVSVQDQRLSIDLDGRSFSLAARVFRPAGNGPFPLVVINHGTPPKLSDNANLRLDFAKAARWFVGQGYVAIEALRPGFGDSDGPYMERNTGSCENRDYVHDGGATAVVEAAVIKSAAQLPGVDAQRIVVLGQSAGGFGATALADAPPPGVVAVISFAGGRGGDDREHICSGADRLIEAEAVFGKANRLPQLWLYAANDHFFPPALAHAMAQAYQSGSTQPIKFVDLPPFGDDGHKTLPDADPSVWSPAVSAFLTDVTKPAAR